MRRCFWNRLPFYALLVAASSFHLAVPALGQTTAVDVSNDKFPKYEVVSVRPSKPKPGEGMRVSTQPNRFSAGNTTLFGLIFNAYNLRPHDDLPGLPEWARSDEFDVEAKMDDDLSAALQKLPNEERGKQRNEMLQAILADRFKLRVHYETRKRAIYSLVIAKGGFLLKDAPEKDWGRGSSWGSGSIEVRGGSIGNLAFYLSDELGRLVKDDTGLTGKYNVQLKWTSDELQEKGDAGPTLFTALQEQLGLKLVPPKGPVEVLIVDHAEKPSEN